MYWSPNFFAMIFKKQEISQQVFLFVIFVLFFCSNNQGRNHGKKVEILELI